MFLFCFKLVNYVLCSENAAQNYTYFLNWQSFFAKNYIKYRNTSLAGLKNAACGDGKFRVRRWQSPQAAFQFPSAGISLAHKGFCLFLYYII